MTCFYRYKSNTLTNNRTNNEMNIFMLYKRIHSQVSSNQFNFVVFLKKRRNVNVYVDQLRDLPSPSKNGVGLYVPRFRFSIHYFVSTFIVFIVTILINVNVFT